MITMYTESITIYRFFQLLINVKFCLSTDAKFYMKFIIGGLQILLLIYHMVISLRLIVQYLIIVFDSHTSIHLKAFQISQSVIIVLLFSTR